MECTIFAQRGMVGVGSAHFAKLVQCLGTSAHIIEALEDKLAEIRAIIFDTLSMVPNRDSLELLATAIAQIFYTATPAMITSFANQQSLKPPSAILATVATIIATVPSAKPILQIAPNEKLGFTRDEIISVGNFIQTCCRITREKNLRNAVLRTATFNSKKTIIVNAYRMRRFVMPLFDFATHFVNSAHRDALAVIVHDTCVSFNCDIAATLFSAGDAAITVVFSREGFSTYPALVAALKK